ncbi:hypothetical protein SCZ71_05755 [Legionella pneumophila serogroup 1]|uniref:Lipoprotein n=1 Tax=Legionella pneumophila TaxID=446 RepID=A0AAP3MAP0_LEGPN|nr:MULTISPECIES: hypothetical protein [Legionella]MCK0182726.1 hypothetical protein [Legionella pneumophila]MCK1870601.1 hypothetical protein [Legionella pneumophila]MCK1880289.1 hypothetical protein [Legionella pneumophila]MCK1889612.1 hypothetical protein [Legionella pneumophila]MCO1452583.1 hypothetical protein [Legionella pneumophila]
MKHFTLVKKSMEVLLVCLSFLLFSCSASVSKEDSKSNTPVKKRFGGYHPHVHGRGTR